MGMNTLYKSVIVYSIIISNFSCSKKLRVPDLGTPKSSKLNECERCKVLTESFNHWLKKTSRGKFDGGDAAWEETKLKSYSRSEVRLVEIQEGLCSELKRNQDQCYSIAEDTEHALEKWWFQDDPNSLDFYTWLCIDTIKYCCPLKHYGPSCSPCPVDKNNNICGLHGKCDGEGTREGNGTCKCNHGFIGEFCNECAKNYYSQNGFCEPCNTACNGCTGAGAAHCILCNTGWQMKAGSCVDIDECSNSQSCKSDQYCRNKEGSYTCHTCDTSCLTCNGDGPSNCTSCESPSELWCSVCVNNKLKGEIIVNCLRRLALYLGLLIISAFIFRKFRALASVVVLIIAVYVYFSESATNFNIVNVIHNIYFK